LPKNDDGEFELILANRQLLSVFFIIVILLAVFFTMGYIVGRNSAPLLADAVTRSAARPVADAAATTAETPAAVAPPSAPAAKPAAETAPPETAAQQLPVNDPPKTTPEAATEPVKPKSAKVSKTEASNRPVTGQAYLQLAATSQHEAEIMVDVLRKKGFKAMAAEIDEKPGTFRVLVGPVADAGNTNKLRSDLQDAGFPGNAAIRRTF
jgi:cell division septation protein DedD